MVVPQSLDLFRGVGVKHSEDHLVLSHSLFQDQLDSLLSSHPFFVMHQWFQVCSIFFRFRICLGWTAHFRFLVPAGPFRPHPLSFFCLLPACLHKYSIVFVYPVSSIGQSKANFQNCVTDRYFMSTPSGIQIRWQL